MSNFTLRALFLGCFLTVFSLLVNLDANAQCGPNDFVLHNSTNCPYNYNMQYTFAPGTCNFAGNMTGVVAPGTTLCLTMPPGAFCYSVRVYGAPYGPIDATVGLPCQAPGTTQGVSDCNNPNTPIVNTVQYSHWVIGGNWYSGVKIY
ncbi:hypothetical protein KFE98_07760 [bacterium SCSIO 12741]|nr:hypothetical protein KFE98_07760 [bacterium SCSIO 12741]